jgi:malonyl CoA-acyl carrier protein transacylase
VVSPVRFAASLEAMALAGIDTFVHVGPGDVTAGMAKRTIEGARVVTVSELADIDAAVGGWSDAR